MPMHGRAAMLQYSTATGSMGCNAILQYRYGNRTRVPALESNNLLVRNIEHNKTKRNRKKLAKKQAYSRRVTTDFDCEWQPHPNKARPVWRSQFNCCQPENGKERKERARARNDFVWWGTECSGWLSCAPSPSLHAGIPRPRDTSPQTP